MSKKIFIGDIKSRDIHAFKTPIEKFQIAIELSKRDNFIVETNNAQFIEALEVLCGEENINIYLKLYGGCKEISFIDAYGYLGDVYDIIDGMRGLTIAEHGSRPNFDEIIEDFIKEYEDKYKEIMGVM